MEITVKFLKTIQTLFFNIVNKSAEVKMRTLNLNNEILFDRIFKYDKCL